MEWPAQNFHVRPLGDPQDQRKLRSEFRPQHQFTKLLGALYVGFDGQQPPAKVDEQGKMSRVDVGRLNLGKAQQLARIFRSVQRRQRRVRGC